MFALTARSIRVLVVLNYYQLITFGGTILCFIRPGMVAIGRHTVCSISDRQRFIGKAVFHNLLLGQFTTKRLCQLFRNKRF